MISRYRESSRRKNCDAGAFDWRAFMGQTFTKLQGQYLTFIAMYTKLHRRPPAEADIQAYFRVTPPSVHNMIVMLERRALISKTPGAPRSIRVLVDAERLPPLE
jgi:repressor LexA